MSSQPDEPKDSGDHPVPSRRYQLRQGLRRIADKAGAFANQAGSSGLHAKDQLSRVVRGKTQSAATQLGKLGEDYTAILTGNPIVLNTLARADLLSENRGLLETTFNIPWATGLLWSAAAADAMILQQPVARAVGERLHYGPGHVMAWNDVNRFMDTVVGSGHRIKFGHSIEYLPQIVEKFGIEGAPAYFMHLAQDVTTADGIPAIPDAWNIKQALQHAGLPRQVATGIVSISFSSTLSALGIIAFVSQLWTLGEAISKKAKTQGCLKTASAAIVNHDYDAAIASYKQVLETDRVPAVLIALGQAYMQRSRNRYYAHHAFKEAADLLAQSPSTMFTYAHAKLSLRGMAGLHALATVDVLQQVPFDVDDYILDLTNGTVFSFAQAASRCMQQGSDLIPDQLVPPAYFSAALNYYLAAKSACFSPFIEDRREKVTRNTRLAIRALEFVAQRDEECLRERIEKLKRLWLVELLPPVEAESEWRDLGK